MSRYYTHKQTKFVYETVGSYQESDGTTMIQLRRVSDGAGPLAVAEAALMKSYRLMQPDEPLSEEDEVQETETKTETKESNLGIVMEPQYTLNDLILTDEVRDELGLGIEQAANAKAIAEAFGNKGFKRTTLNFHGSPGTGKTMSAHAVASRLGKKLYIADYAGLKSKWHGETAKNLKKMFAEAAEMDAVLFLDEADTLLSSRIQGGGSEMSEALNHEKNVFMQELDRFEGVVLMATNLFGNYDEALNRRIARHISFPMPNPTARASILLKMLGNKHQVDVAEAAIAADGLGGGDLGKAVENAQVKAFSRNKSHPLVSHDDLMTEIDRVKRSKIDQGLLSTTRRIGF
jgi:SpoVK/Ycf46/Vps4 family AAA+-type ATPase